MNVNGFTIFWLTVMAALWYAGSRRLWRVYLTERHKRDVPFRMSERVWFVTCALWPLVLVVFFIGLLIMGLYTLYLNHIAHRQLERSKRDDIKPM